MLLAHTAAGVALQVGIEDRRAADLALPVGAVAQPVQRAVHAVEDGGRPAEFRFVAFLHERAG